MTNLIRLLKPRTVAVIGGKECERVIEQCDKLGFTGTIWPIHPRRETMGGRKCFRTIHDLPEAPDAAYVAVNRKISIEVIGVLAKIGAGGAICYAAGFSEADEENEGAAELQNQLVEAAGEMPIIGPNCYGFINTLERVALWPDQHGAAVCERGVAIITQSSNIAINMTMQKRGLPIACVMTAGNQAQLGISELGLGLIEDERITALGLHIEGLDDVKKFERLALRARELGKPIVALKVGKSDQAQTATMTHTASLAGSDVAHDALFNRLGIARVRSLEVMIETLKLLHAGGPLMGEDLLSLSCSGGEASLIADAAAGRNVNFRPYSSIEATVIKQELGEIVTVANPLDYNTFIWGNWVAMERMFTAALLPKFDLNMLVMDFPRNDRCNDADWNFALESFIAAAQKTNTRCAVISSLPETMPEEVATRLLALGIAPLSGLTAAVQAAEAAAHIGKTWQSDVPKPLLSPAFFEGELSTLNEHQAKSELAKVGLNVPNGETLNNPREIENVIRNLKSPLVLKALGISHKTEVGGVILHLHSHEDVSNALKKLSDLSSSFLLEEMAPKPLVELIVGISRDPACGLLLSIGAGGVLAELIDDTTSLLLPTSEEEIGTALATLKIGKLLKGYRGSEAADIDALIANIICIANYAVNNANTLEEVDVNPLFATQFGSVAVDALIIKRKTP